MRYWRTTHFLLFTFFTSCFSYYSIAQKKFVEGELTYLVSIAKDNQNLSKGKFLMVLKGNSVLKELVIGSGFKNKILYIGKENAFFSLKEMGKENLAIQLNSDEFAQKNAKCKNLRVENLESDNRIINNLKTEKAKLHCNNSKPVIITYTKEWAIDNENLFDEFPTFGYLPLVFEIVTEDGSVIKFELEKIDAKPLDNSCVSIPKGYKRITNEEFKTWLR